MARKPSGGGGSAAVGFDDILRGLNPPAAFHAPEPRHEMAADVLEGPLPASGEPQEFHPAPVLPDPLQLVDEVLEAPPALNVHAFNVEDDADEDIFEPEPVHVIYTGNSHHGKKFRPQRNHAAFLKSGAYYFAN